MSTKETLAHLVNALKKGDELAFKAIHDLHYSKLRAFINGFTNDDFETEDILQDTFMKLWSAREKLDAVNSIGGYLYKTSYNTYIDNFRKNKREQSLLDEWRKKCLIEMIEEDDEIESKRVEKMQVAIEKLPTKCKEIFMLCKFEKKTHKQIASQLKISPKTVQSQMCRAYNLIRKWFNDNGHLLLFCLNLILGLSKI